MALSLPARFKAEIIGARDTQLVPLVIIGNYDTDNQDDHIKLSTNVITFFGENEQTYYSKPLITKISSLNESIDIVSRKFKIPSMKFSVSNLSHDGVKFTDLDLVQTSILNKECRVYWTTPSSSRVPTNIEGSYDYFLVFEGVVKQYDVGIEQVNFTIEDKSYSIINKKIPSAIAEDEGPSTQYYNTPDKSLLKPIPMVYGKVNRSPAILRWIAKENPDELSSWLGVVSADNYAMSSFITELTDIRGVHKFYKDPLLAFANDNYFAIDKYINQNENDSSGEYYEIGSHQIFLKNVTGDVDLELAESVINVGPKPFTSRRLAPMHSFRVYDRGGGYDLAPDDEFNLDWLSKLNETLVFTGV